MTDDRPHGNLGTAGVGVYAALMAAHVGFSGDQSARLNVCLVLLMMNHMGIAQSSERRSQQGGRSPRLHNAKAIRNARLKGEHYDEYFAERQARRHRRR
jgi:hypothetical protein